MNRDADSKDHTDVVEEILDHDFEGEGGGRSLLHLVYGSRKYNDLTLMHQAVIEL